MAVNIFGEGVKNGSNGGPGQRGPSGEGFKILDYDGNYDIDSKRLANVATPESGNDAVTKSYVDEDVNNIRKDVASYLIRISENENTIKINEDKIEKLDESVSSGVVDFTDSLLKHRAYIDDLIIGVRKVLIDMKAQDDLSTDSISQITTKLDNVDTRLLGLSTQFALQHTKISDISSTIDLNTNEVKHIKVLLEIMKRSNSERDERNFESITNVLASTRDMLLKLESRVNNIPTT